MSTSTGMRLRHPDDPSYRAFHVKGGEVREAEGPCKQQGPLEVFRHCLPGTQPRDHQHAVYDIERVRNLGDIGSGPVDQDAS